MLKILWFGQIQVFFNHPSLWTWIDLNLMVIGCALRTFVRSVTQCLQCGSITFRFTMYIWSKNCHIYHLVCKRSYITILSMINVVWDHMAYRSRMHIVWLSNHFIIIIIRQDNPRTAFDSRCLTNLYYIIFKFARG